MNNILIKLLKNKFIMLIKHVDTILPKSYIDYRENLKKEICSEVKLQFDTLFQMETVSINRYNQNDDNDFNEFIWSFYSIINIKDILQKLLKQMEHLHCTFH